MGSCQLVAEQTTYSDEMNEEFFRSREDENGMNVCSRVGNSTGVHFADMIVRAVPGVDSLFRR